MFNPPQSTEFPGRMNERYETKRRAKENPKLFPQTGGEMELPFTEDGCGRNRFAEGVIEFYWGRVQFKIPLDIEVGGIRKAAGFARFPETTHLDRIVHVSHVE